MSWNTDPNAASRLSDWALDREVVITRVIGAPRARVFEAWVTPEQVSLWYSPEGFRNEIRSIDIREGGSWRFDYVGPDGKRYDNRMVYRRIEKPRLIELDHGRDIEDDPARFRVTVTFDAQSNGKTVVTLRQIHPTVEQREMVVGFGAVEIGLTTLNNLARHLGV